jgi:hypothetical protein
MGIVGYGYCKFGPQFSLQHHPNVQVAAVSDLFPDRCQGLARECRCEKTYPSLEEMVKDDSIEAVFVATDAPSHCRHAIEVLRHGKHVASVEHDRRRHRRPSVGVERRPTDEDPAVPVTPLALAIPKHARRGSIDRAGALFEGL